MLTLVQTVDMGAVGQMGGMPVTAAAGGPMPGSSSMLSPGSHSPGPLSNVAPSPTHRLANVPSPGIALNTPGELLKAGFHYPSSRPELTARELGCIF